MNKITFKENLDKSGKMFSKKLNFEFLHYSKPNYYYIINKIRRHRFSYRKSKLKLNKEYNSELTEHEIMLKNGNYKIYDSGNMKFLYKN